MDFSAFDHPQPEVSPAEAEVFVSEVYRIAGRASPLSGERDRSFLIDSEPGRTVLKVGNRGDHPDALDTQAAAIAFALRNDPSLPVASIIPTSDGSATGSHSGYQLQLATYIGGSTPPGDDASPEFRRSLGRLIARLDAALAGFHHPQLEREFPWSLPQLPGLRSLAELVGLDRALIEAELDRFEADVAPRLSRLPSQPIHGDVNPANLHVQPISPDIISGVFDFGDLGWAPVVVDLAIAAAYQAAYADPRIVITQMASAYHQVRPLNPAEVELLPDLVAARCVQSLLMSHRGVIANPDNADYLGGEGGPMAETLRQLADLDRGAIVEDALRACALSERPTLSTEEAIAARRSSMAAGHSLTYSEPVHAASATGVWITDAGGRQLLDAYNNVSHVGHGHPDVVNAVSAQLSRLNTNTRYLTDGITEYAQRLTALFPDPLSVVFFTTSGSEANDLAYRIARTVTGGRAALMSANAYHGVTYATAALSPQENDVSSFGAWPTPVAFAPHLDGSLGGLRETLADVDRRLEAARLRPAMAIVDTIFSTEGIHLAPEGFLAELRDWLHERNALLVTDEIQAGFGRVGTRFWGFGDVVPDIVTLGKPIANGYPMGAVITTEEIASRFASQAIYFSTFAGSPVAAAAASAVLDVVEGEGLAAHADELGEYLRSAISELRSVISTRGSGLFIGAELAPDGSADRVVEDMRRAGVLIGRTGPQDNVLKIRPPLVFQRHHAERLLAALGDCLD